MKILSSFNLYLLQHKKNMIFWSMMVIKQLSSLLILFMFPEDRKSDRFGM